jgi:hypothetical protein
MRIELTEYSIDANERFRMLAGNYFRRNGALYVIMGGLWLFLLLSHILRHEAFLLTDIALLVLIPFLPGLYLWRFRTASRPPKDGGEIGRVHALFDDAGITMNSAAAGAETIPWSEITKKEKRGKYILLFVSRFRFLVFPVRAFPSEDSVREVIEFKAEAGNKS